MYTIYKMTIASLKMFVRNRQALFFSLFVPFMILLIFNLMDFEKPIKIIMGVVTHAPGPGSAQFVEQLKKLPAFEIHEGLLAAEKEALQRGDRTVVLDVPDNLFMPADGTPAITALVNGSRPADAQIAMQLINTMPEKAALAMSGTPLPFTMNPQSVSVRKNRYIDFLLPGVVAMAVMQMSVFSVAFVFAQYKEKGILKRLLATPLKPYQFVTANIITRMLVSVIQAYMFVLLGLLIFHVHTQGSYLLLTLCIVMGSLMFLGLGFTVSGLSKTTETVPVLANLVVFPMMFLGGVFFQPGNVPAWLQPITNNLPLTFFAKAMRGVMMDGAGFHEIGGNLLGITIWAVLLVALSILTFRLTERESTG